MKIYRNKGFPGRKRQMGMTLIELLIAGLISVIVASGMIILMANTLGTGTKTIKLTKLAAEMRTAMQIMTRELRRANYHSTYASCFGDLNCLSTLGITDEVSEININGTNDCVWFWYDRPQRCESPPCDADELIADQDAITSEPVAAFRRIENDDGIGLIQMAATLDTSVSCDDDLADDDWSPITDPELVDITGFNVNSAVPNFTSYTWTVNGTQSVERIGVTMNGRLKTDASLPTFLQANSAVLTVRDFIRVRNNVIRP
jgi:type II secretory pathway pseudopilin PulG